MPKRGYTSISSGSQPTPAPTCECNATPIPAISAFSAPTNQQSPNLENLFSSLPSSYSSFLDFSDGEIRDFTASPFLQDPFFASLRTMSQDPFSPSFASMMTNPFAGFLAPPHSSGMSSFEGIFQEHGISQSLFSPGLPGASNILGASNGLFAGIHGHMSPHQTLGSRGLFPKMGNSGSSWATGMARIVSGTSLTGLFSNNEESPFGNISYDEILNKAKNTGTGSPMVIDEPSPDEHSSYELSSDEEEEEEEEEEMEVSADESTDGDDNATAAEPTNSKKKGGCGNGKCSLGAKGKANANRRRSRTRKTSSSRNRRAKSQGSARRSRRRSSKSKASTHRRANRRSSTESSGRNHRATQNNIASRRNGKRQNKNK